MYLCAMKERETRNLVVVKNEREMRNWLVVKNWQIGKCAIVCCFTRTFRVTLCAIAMLSTVTELKWILQNAERFSKHP